MTDRQCVSCGETFIPDPEDNQEMCWECENGVEPCLSGTCGCSVDHWGRRFTSCQNM